MISKEEFTRSFSEKEKYGTLYRPRQGWFKNKNEALKQFIERTNKVLRENIIVCDKNLTNISKAEPRLTTANNLYDVEIETFNDISSVGVNNVVTAQLSVVVENGGIIQVNIDNPGKGYRYPPTVTVNGVGINAELITTIDGLGRINGVSIINPGKNYNNNTTINVRNFSVFVKADETLAGKWSLYERITESNTWNRIRSQSYNTNLYWEYIDWYDTGYNESTEIDYLIDYSYQLTSLDNSIGTIVMIANIGSGGWLLLEKEFDFDTDDYTRNYKTIGRQNGTIKSQEYIV